MSTAHTNVLHDIVALSYTELHQQYGIEIENSTGEVWDPVEFQSFDSLREWAGFIIELEKEDAKWSSQHSFKTARWEDD